MENVVQQKLERHVVKQTRDVAQWMKMFVEDTVVRDVMQKGQIVARMIKFVVIRVVRKVRNAVAGHVFRNVIQVSVGSVMRIQNHANRSVLLRRSVVEGLA